MNIRKIITDNKFKSITNFGELSFLEICLIIVSGVLIFSGLAVCIIFLLSLSNTYTIHSNSILDLEACARVGDYIGGFIGSMWALASTLLFFLAILLQSKEIKNQNKTLIQQNYEFETARLTNILYSQISRIDKQMDSFYIRNIRNNQDHIGLNGVKTIFDNLKQFDIKVDHAIDLNLIQNVSYIKNNLNFFFEPIEILNQGIFAYEKAVATANLLPNYKTYLRDLFFNNISAYFLHKTQILNSSLNYMLSDNSLEFDKLDFENLFNLTKEILNFRNLDFYETSTNSDDYIS